MKRRALITGITGFIGRALARRLLETGWQVDALIRPMSDVRALPFAEMITFHTVDDGQELTPIFTAARPDVVFHLASLYLAEHRQDQVEALVRSNVLLPAMLAEAMTAAGVTRIVNTGTAWQHFKSAEYRPVNLYAATKQAAEDLLLFYADARELSMITLRLFDTYGAGDKRRKLVQILIDAAQSNEALAMSPGDQIVDLTHVEDVAEGFLIAAERLLGSSAPLREEYLLSGERYSIKELTSLVSSSMACPVRADFGGRPYRLREVMEPIVPTPSRLLVGWHPRRTIRQYIEDQR